MLFRKILEKSRRKRKKLCVDKGSAFYNRSIKSWLEDNDIEMHSKIIKENLLLLKGLLEP